MTRALVAAFKSGVMADIDRRNLDPDEAVRALLDLAIYRARKAGLDRRALLALADDMFAAQAVEGRQAPHE